MVIATNILADREPFIGRVREQAQLEEALRADERLIVITGLAGMGKARLARQVTQSLGPELAPTGGVWFVDVEGVQSRSVLASMVAGVLGLQGEGSPKSQETRLAKVLAGRGPLLLVLACCESLEPRALELIQSWLDRAPSLQIVVTSLVRPAIEGGFLFELGPLEPAEAVALYEDRAGRAWADRSFVTEERRTISELVERLDRIPLAIELAAARVRVLPPRAMLLRIGDRFELLQSRRVGDRTSLERAIRLSWDRLDPAERRALTEASIFAGSFSMEVAQEVILPGEEGPSVGELMESLRGQGLLRREPSHPSRYYLYESVQAFGARELLCDGGGEAVAGRHAASFLRLAKEWVGRLEAAEDDSLLALVAIDQGNLRLALQWVQAQEGGAGSEDEALLGGLLRRVETWIAASTPPEPGEGQVGLKSFDGISSIGSAVFGGRSKEMGMGARGDDHLQMVPGIEEVDGAGAKGRPGQDELVVGPDAVWFELAGKERVQLGRRGAQRRVLQALVENRLLAPGQGLSLEQMSRVGWPGETVSPAAAANRVYNCVNSLRKAGLGAALERRSEGYLLSPDLPVYRSRD